MGDNKRRKLGSREAFTIPVLNEGDKSFENPNTMFQTPTKPTSKSKGYVSTPEKSSSATLSNNELAELYSNCIKLATEGKITQKNSWQLNLIDYMEDMFEVSGDNFQAASCTLDASVKIYSCRVDSVHTDTYKVLGGLTRTEREIEEIGEQEDEAEEVPEIVPIPSEPESARKQKIRKLSSSSVNTLESNVEALNAKRLDVAFAVDPLFRKTSAAFDQGGVRGLLLNHLEVQQGCTLVFDSVDAIDLLPNEVAPDNADLDSTCSIDELCGLLAQGGDLGNIDNLDICPTFSQFTFDGVRENVEIPPDKENESESEVSDEEIPLDLNFSTLSDPSFAANSSMDNSVEVEGNISWIKNELVSPNINLQVVGADHWQFASSSKEKSEPKKKSKTKKPKQAFFIDFYAPPPPEGLFKVPEVGKRDKTTLPMHTWDKTKQRLTLLRNEPAYDVISNLTRLFIKSGDFTYSDPDSSEEESQSSGESNSNFEDSLNDTSFIPERKLEMEEGEDDHSGLVNAFLQPREKDEGERKEDKVEKEKEEIVEEEIGGLDRPDAFMEDNGGHEIEIGGGSEFGAVERDMVQEPQRVVIEPIKYATVANRVDLKALKAIMWTELNAHFKEGGGEVEFNDLLQRVNARVQQQNDVGEISAALCFICVLHLSNEKGLVLLQEARNIDQLVISTK